MADELNVANDRAARDYWSEARALLNDTTKKKLEKILDAASQTQAQGDTPRMDSSRASFLDVLRRSCIDRKKEYEDKKWSITIKGNKYPLHTKWDTVINILGKLDGIGRIATSVDSASSLGWSIFQLFTQV
jgi:hypothetical protein